ncbi:oligosaccharide repeat unit polymerase [Rhodopirellula sp. P2]|uniref:oligosaccharide repeat unit polymerase n=1 Tax=Rhodopirellula sp. P2 TaxID=2127060 RepID=UPI00236803CB|nr:oligosaccharide repeat unit polymerase [Rhodopirellula sp. P2]WDQ17492.1 oligosaccharide repeat unit polymerase [Rhodopirellula sp. P2]
MVLALLTWAFGVSFLLFFFLRFIKAGNIAASAVLGILIPQVFVRPVIFFFGFDRPFPYEYFESEEWVLVGIALVAASVWILVFSITHMLMIRPMATLGNLFPHPPSNSSLNILLLVTIFTTGIGLLATGRLISNAGSIARFMYNVKIEKELSGFYVVREISVVGAIFASLAFVSFAKLIKTRGKTKNRILFMSASVVLLATNLACNYFWGNRYNIAMLVIALAGGWHFSVSSMKLRYIVALALIVAAGLQGLKAHRNFSVATVAERETDRDQSFWLDISTSLHFTQFDAFMLALRDAGDRFDFRDGKDFINGMLSWIPRQLYSDKESFHVGKWFRQVYYPNVVNGWPVTTIGSWYVNFGGWGILFGGLISGLTAAVFDSAFQNVRGSPWRATMGWVLALLLFDGGVGTGFVQRLFLIFLPVILLAVTLRLFRVGCARDEIAI